MNLILQLSIQASGLNFDTKSESPDSRALSSLRPVQAIFTTELLTDFLFNSKLSAAGLFGTFT